MPCAAADASDVRVLYINSYHRGYAWSDGIEQGLREHFEASNKKIELSVEFLDSRRFASGTPNQALIHSVAETLAIKYTSYRPALVVVSDNAAFDFVVAQRERLFSGLPIVFCGYNYFRPELIKGRIDNITGVNEEVSLADTVEMAVKVHPATRTLAFVTSTSDASTQRISDYAEQQLFPQLAQRFKLVILKNAAVADMQRQLAQLPAETLVFLAGRTSDRSPANREYTPEENGRLLAAASPFPVYALWDFHLGTGVLGGHIITGPDQGRAAAELALRILDGSPADAIPVVMTTPTANIFDYRVMQRFGISPDHLPPHAQIINRPPSAWDSYRNEIIATLVLVLVQTLFISLLLRINRQRKQALNTVAQERALLEQRVQERTLEANHAREMAEAANHAKSIFLANMSHELRTPLNAILGFSEMVDRNPETPPAIKEKVAIINRSGEHLLAMINDVLDLSKIEAGKIALEPEAIDLPALIQDIGCMFEIRAQAAGLRFSSELAPDIARYIRVDGNKLRQVLINLLGNAVKFTREGGFALRVRTEALPDQAAALRLHLEVRDSGPGIPTDQIQAIFQPFVQVAKTRAAQKGTGLGLTISKSLVELMGGQLGVDSAPGQGALFWVDLPVELAHAEQARQEVLADVIGLAAEQASWRILVAEDDPENRLLLVSLLSATGFDVREAENGGEAVALFEQWRPHLIFMDMRMPELDGYQATQHIRALPGGEPVKIVALTASVFREQRQYILDAGCNGIIHKPYRNHEIFDTLAEQLGVRYDYRVIDSDSILQPPMAEIELLAAIAQLAPQPKNELIDAAQCGDQERFEAALQLLEAPQDRVAATLKRLSDGFQYDKILDLLLNAPPASDEANESDRFESR